MLDNLLKEVVVIIAGKSAEPIADLLNSQKYANEFNIAKKLDITINQTRNILYKISDHGLVLSERKKDKKKGWYTYFWRFDVLKSLEFLKNLLNEKKSEILKEISAREKSVFYACKLCNLEYDENQALLMDFTCDECGELFETKDNSKLIKDLNNSLKRIDDKLKIIEEEIQKELNKSDKKKSLDLKKREKEKEEKKLEAKKKRELKRKEAISSKKIQDKKVKEKVPKKKETKSKIKESKKIKSSTKKLIKKSPKKK